MLLPNGEHSIIDDAKLRDYCLNPAHRVGRHKSKLFAKLLGLTLANTMELKAALLAAARESEVISQQRNPFGIKYTIDFQHAGPGATATIRSAWIIRDNENFPRLITCYPIE